MSLDLVRGPALDWEALDAAFPWVQRLRGCPQDRIHHAEGDVWIHTRLVLEALVASAAYRALEGEARALAFAGALLHDVGKPERTRNEPDGRISSRGHSGRGAVIARRILWELGATPAFREQVAAIVLHHQVPMFLVERAGAARTAHEVSWRARCDLLAVVAEADGRGRSCADQGDLLDRIELFRELCREEECFDAPRAFASPHSRFLYFRSPDRDPRYEAHDDTRSELVLLSGLPGCGKDHYVEHALGSWPVVSLDAIRRELGVAPDDKQGTVVQEGRARLRAFLREQRNVVWNATSLSRRARAPILDLAADYRARVRIVCCEASPATIRRRNRARPRPVPEAILQKMLDRWEAPDATEAHEVVFADCEG